MSARIIYSRCISDEIIPGISFDTKDICNFCRKHEEMDMLFLIGVKCVKYFKKLEREN